MREPRDRNGGYILIAVLSIMLLVTGLMAAASVLVRSALHTARLGDLDVAAAGLSQGGLEIVAYELFVLKLPLRAVDGRRTHLAGATLTPTVIDEAGKVDLNGADPKLLRSLFLSIGMEAGPVESLVDDIVAFRGTTGTPNPPGTAPSQAPAPAQTQAPAPGTAPATAPSGARKQRGFQSVEQLGDFPDVTRADLDALTPMLTVFNPDGKVNILTAREDVLQALPGLTRPKIEDILAHREGADKATATNLQSMLGEAAAFAKVAPGPAYTVRVEAAAAGRRRMIAAVVAASKSPNEPFYILDWRE